MNRRDFLKVAAATSAAVCIEPTLNKVSAAERALTGHRSAVRTIPAGIGFVPYSPLNRGFLGGMINEYTRFDPDNDNRQTLPRFQPDAIRTNTRIVEVLNAFGRTRGITPAQVHWRG